MALQEEDVRAINEEELSTTVTLTLESRLMLRLGQEALEFDQLELQAQLAVKIERCEVSNCRNHPCNEDFNLQYMNLVLLRTSRSLVHEQRLSLLLNVLFHVIGANACAAAGSHGRGISPFDRRGSVFFKVGRDLVRVRR